MATDKTIEQYAYLFGQSHPLDKNNLPTFGDILQHYNWVIAKGRTPSLHDILSEVCDIWHKHNIPHSHAKSRVTKLKGLLKKYEWLERHAQHLLQPEQKAGYLTKLREFKLLSSELFDISLCKCVQYEVCNCNLNHKVPQEKRDFLQKERLGRVYGKADVADEATAIYYYRAQGNDDLRYGESIDDECNILLLTEPNSEVIDQIPIRKDKTNEIFLKLISCLQFRGETMDNVLAIGSDGLGLKVVSAKEDDDYDDLIVTGVIPMMEKFLNRPLHHFVSMLYINDMLLKFLCQDLNVISMDKNVTRLLEPIGRDLSICEYIQLNRFPVIDAPHIPVNIDREMLNSNELYLYRMALAVTTKFWDQDLAVRQPEPIHNQNAVTLASRILRLYVSKMQPSKELIMLATYVCQVYIPMLVRIRCNNLCHNGSKHMFKLLEYVTNLPTNCAFSNFEDYFKKFAFFLHPENLILAMVLDANWSVRRQGCRKILQARKNARKEGDAIRVFQMPDINFKAVDYTHLIYWERTPIFEPPVTMKYTDAEIEESMNDSSVVLDIPKYPC